MITLRVDLVTLLPAENENITLKVLGLARIQIELPQNHSLFQCNMPETMEKNLQIMFSQFAAQFQAPPGASVVGSANMSTPTHVPSTSVGIVGVLSGISKPAHAGIRNAGTNGAGIKSCLFHQVTL
jgi:hypothetical protein